MKVNMGKTHPCLRVGMWAANPVPDDSFPPRSHLARLPLPARQGPLLAKSQRIAGPLHPPREKRNLQGSTIERAKPALS